MFCVGTNKAILFWLEINLAGFFGKTMLTFILKKIFSSGNRVKLTLDRCFFFFQRKDFS